MNFTINEAIEVLERTPQTLESFLSGLSRTWLDANEGEGTWNPREVVDHLIECEKNNWIPRIESILQSEQKNELPPFDRFSHLNQVEETSIDESLLAFKTIRAKNVNKLKEIINPEIHLERIGIHPAFGEVRLSELISTWVVHDLTHISQIVRVMAEGYRVDVGPWEAYLGILKK